MNGYGISNYNTTPKGWDHIDAIVSGCLVPLMSILRC